MSIMDNDNHITISSTQITAAIQAVQNEASVEVQRRVNDRENYPDLLLHLANSALLFMLAAVFEAALETNAEIEQQANRILRELARYEAALNPVADVRRVYKATSQMISALVVGYGEGAMAIGLAYEKDGNLQLIMSLAEILLSERPVLTSESE